MALFSFRKKQVEEKVPCKCGGMCTPSEIAAKEQASKITKSNVKVLGSCCSKCNELESSTVAALIELGMDSSVEHISDFAEIASYGVMSTPALVVDGKVVSYGKALSKNEVIEILQKLRS